MHRSMILGLSDRIFWEWHHGEALGRVRLNRWVLMVYRKLCQWWAMVHCMWTGLWRVMWYNREDRRLVFIAMEAEAHRIVMEGSVGIALRANARAEQRKEMEHRRRLADFQLNLSSQYRKLKIDKDGRIGLVCGSGPTIDERQESTQPTNVESTATSSTDNRRHLRQTAIATQRASAQSNRIESATGGKRVSFCLANKPLDR